MIEKFLLNLPCGERGRFLWRACVCAILWVLWNERNRRVFRGLEKGSKEIWLVLPYRVSPWASILKTFCNYSLDFIWLDSLPVVGSHVFCASMYSLIFLSMKVVYFKKKEKKNSSPIMVLYLPSPVFDHKLTTSQFLLWQRYRRPKLLLM